MDNKLKIFAYKISQFPMSNDPSSELDLLGTASDLKIEIDKMVENVIEMKKRNDMMKKLVIQSLTLANSVQSQKK